MFIRGKVIKFGDNVDTDVIIPARYLTSSDPLELASHCMEDLDPSFTKRVTKETVLVAGKNFGCGSSREHAPLSIKASGVQAIVAESFARIFYRNAINIGLPILESAEAARGIQEGDEVEIDLQTEVIRDATTGETFQAQAFRPSCRKSLLRTGS